MMKCNTISQVIEGANAAAIDVATNRMRLN